MRKLIVLAAGLAAALLISHGANALSPFHEDIASGGLDPDGDHLRTTGGFPINDPQPTVYCGAAHADVPTPAIAGTRNGAVNLSDVVSTLFYYGTTPPDPLYDQNHNDVIDWPDIDYIASLVGSNYISGGPCTSVTPGIMPVSGPSAYAGAPFYYTVPVLPASGTFTVTVSLAGTVPFAYDGYFVSMNFNEASVQAVSAASLIGGSLCPPSFTGGTFIDNADDAIGDDGSVGVGCALLSGSTSSGDILNFTFNRISGAPPNFRLNTCGSPDYGGTLHGTYTISATDHGPQVEAGVGPCHAGASPAQSYLAIDADPTNGSAPCAPFDPVRIVWETLSYDVAVCLIHGLAPSSLDLALVYDSARNNAPSVAPDGSTDLDGNPDLNGGSGAGVGSGWDCSIGGLDPPSGMPPPATLSCAGTPGLVDPGHVATLHLTATAAGVGQLHFAAGTELDDSPCYPAGNVVCGSALIRIRPAPTAICGLELDGAWATSNPSEFRMRRGGAVWAIGQIPSGKTSATLNVRYPDGSLAASKSVTGSPGTPVELLFTVHPPLPLTVECVVVGLPNETLTIIGLLDPSGRIFDVSSGASIVGATATLETDSDTGVGQSWVAMSPVTHAGYFEPEVNPEATDLGGRYAWDVAPYYPQPIPNATNDYRVQVSAPGCSPTTSTMVTVPPPVTTLDVGLTCVHSDSDGIRDEDEINVLGTDPLLDDTDGDGTTDDHEDADGDGLTDLAEIIAETNPLDADTDDDTLTDRQEVLVHLTNALNVDTDDDGCSDKEELGGTTALGGNRDPLSLYDFFDVPAPASGLLGLDGKLTLLNTAKRNKAISLSDVGVVLAYVGRTAGGAPGNTYYNGDLNGDGIADGLQLDRTPAVPSGSAHLGPPNGAISLSDVGVALSQVGHNCAAAP